MSDDAPHPSPEPLPGHPHGDPPPPERAWVYLDHDQAHQALTRLREWIGDVLIHEPVIDFVRPCWYRHPAAVQALLDARAVWKRAYRSLPDDDTTLSWTADWSQRHLPHLEQRLVRLLKQCTTVRHDPLLPRLPVPTAADVATYLWWWTTDRHSDTEPLSREPSGHDGLSPRHRTPDTSNLRKGTR